MKLLVYSYLLALCCTGGVLKAQIVDGPSGGHFTNYRTEKIYVSHDKPYYAAGETVWCSVFLVDGETHLAYAGTPVVYADWIGPAGDLRRTHTLQIRDGIAPLDIPTSREDTTGIYTLRVYSNYQRNFEQDFIFQKQIHVIGVGDQLTEPADTTAPDFSLRFFPEGGHLVTGIQSTVAFKALDASGENISVRGKLTDAAGMTVSNVMTLNEGMGLFELRAQVGEQYYVTATYAGVTRRFPLPAPLVTGYTLGASTRDAESIRLSLRAGEGLQLGGCRLVGTVRGRVFLNLATFSGETEVIGLPKTDVPSGLLRFTLFDPDGKPHCERLVFNKNPQEKVITSLETTRDVYAKRAPVSVDVSTLLDTEAVAARMSLSVYLDQLTDVEVNQLNVVSYLWLQSELRGRVNNIQQYFATDDARTNTLLDLLLLTHGWRKFKLADQQYPPEEHLVISGAITKGDREKPIPARVKLSVLSTENFNFLETTTGEDGSFAFDGIDFTDSTEVRIEATTVKDNRYVDVRLYGKDHLPYVDSLSFPSTVYRPEALEEYAYNTIRNQTYDPANPDSWSIDLETITVTTGRSTAQIREAKIKKRYREKGVFYFGGTQKFDAADPLYEGFRKTNVYELIAVVVPSATYAPSGGVPRVILGSIRDGRSPVIVLDGKIMTASALMHVNPDHIAVIEVLTDMKARHYHDTSSVVSLISKDPDEIVWDDPGVINFTHPGYYAARDFYAPDYSATAIANGESPSAADYRTTLYWNPEVVTTDGNATLSFYTGDQSGKYLVRVEGITTDGLPCVGETSFSVN